MIFLLKPHQRESSAQPLSFYSVLHFLKVFLDKGSLMAEGDRLEPHTSRLRIFSLPHSLSLIRFLNPTTQPPTHRAGHPDSNHVVLNFWLVIELSFFFFHVESLAVHLIRSPSQFHPSHYFSHSTFVSSFIPFNGRKMKTQHSLNFM